MYEDLFSGCINHCGGAISNCLDSFINKRLPRSVNFEAMKIFLAGGISGNLREFWNEYICRYNSSDKAIEDAMRVFLAGDNGKKGILCDMIPFGSSQKGDPLSEINILESFYYLRNNESFMAISSHFGSFLLDSGAFTFMAGSHKGEIDWDDYVRRYAAFINKWDVSLFFELDIDPIVGIKEVERLRSKLESLTNKKPIPVWHKSRGKDYFIKMCENYPYVALGGIVTKEIPRNIYEKAFPWFIKTAHDHGCKIHGLGYTTVSNLHRYRFDSVDSTAWLYGNRGGYLYIFNPKTGLMDQLRKGGCRLKPREAAMNNFNEWVKFGVYARNKL